MRQILPIVLLCTLLFSTNSSFGQKLQKGRHLKIERKIQKFVRKTSSKKSKVVATALDLSMGLLGVHRLYLGTSTKVPILYTITLGGGGFLVLTDLVIIITAKDFEKHSNNPHVLMWNIDE